MRIFLSGLLLLSAAQAAPLDDYLRLATGHFTSAAQAATDSRYELAIWHIAEIWPAEPSATRWLYTESWMDGAESPYLQRISSVEQRPDGSLITRRYSIPGPERFVGAWQQVARFDALEPGQLASLDGCDIVLVRAGTQRFEGGTQGAGCRNGYKGASYAISQGIVTVDGMINWDRGFNADGEQVWGPAAGGYRFRRADTDHGCVKPVRMLVYGEIRDRERFAVYARAVAESGLYPANGGFYEAATPPLEVFEGSPPPGRGVVIARFPCLEAARDFWYSDEYAAIRPLREGIADFEVLVLPAPPLPAWAD